MSSALRREARFVYGEAGDATAAALERLAEEHRARHALSEVPPAQRMTERDAVLITYADTLQSEGEAPLRTLAHWLTTHLADTVSTVHLLPFYPWSSDDGFSVMDYEAVDGRYGTWSDVEALRAHHRLAFDAVINHASARGTWFEAYLAGREPQARWFRSEHEHADTTSVVRPRVSPLLTPFDTSTGRRWLWTTFGADQVDLDYRDPGLLIEVARILLVYVGHGAEVLRMDAVTYLWKELGTPCVHHPKTHGVMRLLRAFLEEAAPHVVVLTETNVPHAENVSYFGSGHDEAQMVYNFALPPLTLHATLREDATVLRDWASTLATPSDETWFLNFLASHDGIGVRPVEALLPAAEVDALVEHCLACGGKVGMKRGSDGRDTPYELNVNLFDALAMPGVDPEAEVNVARFVVAHAVMMALPGVPALYVHSLLGSRGSPDLVASSGIPRRINRATLNTEALGAELLDPASRRSRILRAMKRLLRARRGHPAFHPSAPHEVLDTPCEVLGLRRGTDAPVDAFHNLSRRTVVVQVDRDAHDLIGGRAVPAGEIEIEPFGVAWLAVDDD